MPSGGPNLHFVRRNEANYYDVGMVFRKAGKQEKGRRKVRV
jgi:hypothetical protein